MKKATICLVISILALVGNWRASRAAPPAPASVNSVKWAGTIAFKEPRYYTDPQSTELENLWYLTPSANRMITDQVHWYGSIRWSPNGQYLACQISTGGYSNELRLFDRSGNPVPGMKGHVEREFQWLNDSSGVLSGVYFEGIFASYVDGRVKQLLNSYNRTYDHMVTLSPDQKWTFFVHHEFGSNATLYRVATDQLLAGTDYTSCQRLDDFTTNHDESVQLIPRMDGRLVIGYGTGTYIFDPDTRTSGPKLPIAYYDMARLSPNARFIAVEAIGDIYVLDAQTLAPVAHLGDVFADALAWSPDSDAIAYVEDHVSSNAVMIWSLADNTQTAIYKREWPSTGGPSIQTAYGEQDFALDWVK